MIFQTQLAWTPLARLLTRPARRSANLSVFARHTLCLLQQACEASKLWNNLMFCTSLPDLMLSQSRCLQANEQKSCAAMHVYREALAPLLVRHLSHPCMQLHRWILQPMQYVSIHLRVLHKRHLLCCVFVYMLHT